MRLSIVVRTAPVALILWASTIANAQQAVAPPPKPADGGSHSSAPPVANNGPSLEVTSAFIKAKIENVGDLRYTLVFQDGSTAQGGWGTGPDGFSHLPRPVVTFEPTACSIRLTTDNVTTTAVLTDLEKVTVGTSNGFDPLAGGARISPDFPQLRLFFSKNSVQIHAVYKVPDTSQKVDKKHPQMWVEQVQDKSVKELLITFDDADVADRVGKALVHASELCGGGNKDPF
jgi:hypothetical protein